MRLHLTNQHRGSLLGLLPHLTFFVNTLKNSGKTLILGEEPTWWVFWFTWLGGRYIVFIELWSAIASCGYSAEMATDLDRKEGVLKALIHLVSRFDSL